MGHFEDFEKPEPSFHPAVRLNELLAEAGSAPLPPELGEQFSRYLTLLQRWNARTNLSAIREEESILNRHFVECILAAHLIPVNVVSLLDFGSGAGFPGLPIALLRPEIDIVLAESQNKKAAFLREAVRVLRLKTHIESGRAETIKREFECVTLRAVDNMAVALPSAAKLLFAGGWLAVLTTVAECKAVRDAVPDFFFLTEIPMVPRTNRVLLMGQKPFGLSPSC